jgi:hypothetical protein
MDNFIGFGNGGAGAFSSFAPIQAVITSTGGIGTRTVNAVSASFAAGQIILLMQMRGANAGKMQLNQIESYAAGVITTVIPVPIDFNSAVSPQAAVCMVLDQYSSVTPRGDYCSGMERFNWWSCRAAL